MQATAMTINPRESSEQARMRALVRFNGSAFHSLAAASFLETAVPQHVERAARALGGDLDTRAWMEQVWWPRRAELGRQLREYVEATWPEFDWSAAWQEFRANYRPVSGLEGARGGTARAALGLCATETQIVLLYGTFAASADDPQLRALARAAAAEHARFFEFFHALFERLKRAQRVGFIATWRTVIAVSRSARDHDVAAAFRALGDNWQGTAIVAPLDYPEFRRRMAHLIGRHAAPGPLERLLFRPWLQGTRAIPVAERLPEHPDPWLALAPRATVA